MTGKGARSATALAFAGLAVVMLLWSGNMIVGRAIRDDIPPFTLAFIRWTGAFCVLLPFAARHLKADQAILRRAWKPVLILGLGGVASFNAFIYSGLHHTTATNALLLQAAIPALVIGFDRLLFRLVPQRWQMIGVATSTLGVIVIIARGEAGTLLRLHFGIGDLLVLGGVLTWAFYTSFLKLRPACNPLSFLAVTFAIGIAAMMPLAATEWRDVIDVEWTAKVIAACAYVAVFPSVIAYALYNRAVAEVGAARAGQAINLMPLFGALLAASLLDEPLLPFHFAGMAFILAGIAISAIRNPETRHAKIPN